MAFHLRSGLHVEEVGDTIMVLDPDRVEVLNLTGTQAEAFRLARSGTTAVPEHLTTVMAGLCELGIVETNTWTRRRILQMGGAAAAAAVVVTALPSIAAAASQPDGGGTTTTVSTTSTTLPSVAPDWHLLSPTTSPPVRQNAAMSQDASGNPVLFGGIGSSVSLNDTWIWNGTTWNQQFPTTSPSGRTEAVMGRDASGNPILFGGNRNGYLNDTWTWY